MKEPPNVSINKYNFKYNLMGILFVLGVWYSIIIFFLRLRKVFALFKTGQWFLIAWAQFSGKHLCKIRLSHIFSVFFIIYGITESRKRNTNHICCKASGRDTQLSSWQVITQCKMYWYSDVLHCNNLYALHQYKYFMK